MMMMMIIIMRSPPQTYRSSLPLSSLALFRFRFVKMVAAPQYDYGGDGVSMCFSCTKIPFPATTHKTRKKRKNYKKGGATVVVVGVHEGSSDGRVEINQAARAQQDRQAGAMFSAFFFKFQCFHWLITDCVVLVRKEEELSVRINKKEKKIHFTTVVRHGTRYGQMVREKSQPIISYNVFLNAT